MELVPGFVQLLQPLAAAMTTPTFDSLLTVLIGWVFARRRTVTQMILAAGSSADKHYSSYHRVFSAARWSLDALGLAVFDMMLPLMGEVVMLGLDDTLARKRGMKMFGCGMHYDPLLFEPRQEDRQLGPQLGHAGRDRRVAVSPRPLLLPADPVSLVLEQEEGPGTSPGLSQTIGAGSHHAVCVV